MRTTAALVLAGSLLLATPAFAAERDNRDSRGSSTPAPAPAVVVPAPQQPITPGLHYSNNSSGNISSNTSSNTASGNNQGSNVVTGDQSNTVTVVNIGPTNNNTHVGTPPAQPQPQPAPSCTGRDCPRTR